MDIVETEVSIKWKIEKVEGPVTTIITNFDKVHFSSPPR